MPDNPVDAHSTNDLPCRDDNGGAETVTVLRAQKGKILTKRWTKFRQGPPQETGYDLATWFSATEYLVSNIRELGALVREISAEPQAAIVRGAVAEGANRNYMLRRKVARGPVAATLIARSHRWVGLDIEKVEPACRRYGDKLVHSGDPENPVLMLHKKVEIEPLTAGQLALLERVVLERLELAIVDVASEAPK